MTPPAAAMLSAIQCAARVLNAKNEVSASPDRPRIAVSRVAGTGRRGTGEEGGTVKKDEAQGRVEEAAGDLTGDKDLQRKGKTDQAAGKAKDAVDSASDKTKDVISRD